MYVLYDTLLSSTCDNNIFQSQNARRTSLTVMPRAKMVYSQTSSLPESQVNRGCDVRMQAATFESFSMVAILPRIQMGKQGSIEIARYARTPPHYFMLRIQRMQLILCFTEKRALCLLLSNTIQHSVVILSQPMRSVANVFAKLDTLMTFPTGCLQSLVQA